MIRKIKFGFLIGLIALLAFPISGSLASSPDHDLGTLEWIHTDGKQILDANGRVVTLRGFVTITNTTDGSQKEYTLEDYQRMRAMGANYQSIRVHAGLIGAWPERIPSPWYLQRLDRMVELGKQAGMYTQFKLTLYDIGNNPEVWGQLWANQNGEQEAVIQGWKVLWERYKDEPAVVGYNLLNEPEQRNISGTTDEFVRDHLNPFYRQAIDELRTIDDRHLVFFQPPIGLHNRVPIGRDRVVYAPHFFPNFFLYVLFSDFTPRGYEAMIQRHADDARRHDAPLLIGEFGMPWDANRDGDASLETSFQNLERTAIDLFDQYQVGFSRPWFSDDRTGMRIRDRHLTWAVIKGTEGLAGEERRFITDEVARPYPRRLGGSLTSFAYNPSTRVFTLRYTPSSTGGYTELYVPRTRHYAGGFSVTFSDGTSVVYDPAAASGVRIVNNPANLDASSFVWDEARQSLSIREWRGGVAVTLTLGP
jgi:endoglycosylceramidase